MTTHTHTHTKNKQSGENSDDPRSMEMAKTLVDYSVDGSAWVDVFFCYRAAEKHKQLHCWLQFVTKTQPGGGWSRSPRGANGAKQELLPQPHMQPVGKNHFRYTWGRRGMSHHAPLLRATKQEGKVKA